MCRLKCRRLELIGEIRQICNLTRIFNKKFKKVSFRDRYIDPQPRHEGGYDGTMRKRSREEIGIERWVPRGRNGQQR